MTLSVLGSSSPARLDVFCVDSPREEDQLWVLLAALGVLLRHDAMPAFYGKPRLAIFIYYFF